MKDENETLKAAIERQERKMRTLEERLQALEKNLQPDLSRFHRDGELPALSCASRKSGAE